jgi:hypothetical protein
MGESGYLDIRSDAGTPIPSAARCTRRSARGLLRHAVVFAAFFQPFLLIYS